MRDILQLTVILNKTEPLIWRRVLVPATVTFFDLHHIFQIAMGWTNSHLFEFQLGDATIGYRDEQLEGFENVIDANKVRLAKVLKEEGMTFSYLYDFGDYWRHTITVEDILTASPRMTYPVCLHGQLRCPPEDCGSISGFYDLLAILKDKRHPEYKESKAWVGKDYDPDEFDLVKINKELPRYRKYMKHWED